MQSVGVNGEDEGEGGGGQAECAVASLAPFHAPLQSTPALAGCYKMAEKQVQMSFCSNQKIFTEKTVVFALLLKESLNIPSTTLNPICPKYVREWSYHLTCCQVRVDHAIKDYS